MPIMGWSNELDVGVHEMNKEHQKLLDIMNRLYDESAAKKGRSVLLGSIDELAKWTIHHFKDEEAYMESIKFEGLKTHKIIHQQLLEKFTEHAKAFQESSAEQLPDGFFSFLKVWLTAHIKGIDMKYGHGLKGVHKTA